MIDPIHSLAFSIQANPGIYAVLVGSGVSRAAKIPTGWEITLDLIRKLAVLHGENCEPDPERWYRDKFDKEADYSDLLDALAKTRTERQQLLRPYWEPNDQEREEGVKRPTAAHKAIATLAARDFIKVIITTNFDRLLESALRDQGVEPTILSSPDQVKGAPPLIHTRCCVIKLHGDYLDTRILNTSSELDHYPQEFDDLLDRIFDEFGLIICGWSAEWDGALRSAINRTPSRRFTTYWAAHGTLGDEAQRLINHRSAHVIRIEDADTFFTTIQQHVESIDEFSRPHPLSMEAAVASLKRYIPEPRYRIQLSDLVEKTVDRIIETVSGNDFSAIDQAPNTGSVTMRVWHYEAVCSTLLAMAAVGGFWVEEDHYSVWQRALERLAFNSLDSGYTLWSELQRYPATLLFYTLGLGAVESNRLRFVEHLLGTKIRKQYENDVSAVEILPPSCLFARGGQEMRILAGKEQHYAPLNDKIHDMLYQHFQHITPHKDKYTLTFDKFEIFIALNYIYRTDQSYLGDRGPWAPPGIFAVSRNQNRDRIMKEIEQSLLEDQNDSPFVKSGIFGKSTENCFQIVKQLQEFIPKLGWW